MRGRLWLKYFTQTMESERKKHTRGEKWSDGEWTEFLGQVMDKIGKKMKCDVIQKRPKGNDWSGEYLNIDAFFIDLVEYDLYEEEEEWGPFALPRAIVELENQYDPKKIAYCLWKILCVRSPIRVLVCYQRTTDKIKLLKQYLEDVIWQGSLMKGTDGDLLVIIGDDSTVVKKTWGTYFGDYFTVFEWKSDRLEEIAW